MEFVHKSLDGIECRNWTEMVQQRAEKETNMPMGYFPFRDNFDWENTEGLRGGSTGAVVGSDSSGSLGWNSLKEVLW